MSDTTPQQQAVELIAAFIAREVGDADLLGIMREQAERLTKELADAGLLCSSPVVRPEEDGSLRSKPAALDGDSAVYIRLSNRAVNETVSHYAGTVNVDMDDYDEPVGIEVLGASSVTVDGIEVSR